MSSIASDRWAGMAWSVLLHALVAALVLWVWWQWKAPVRLGERLAIEASVVQLAPVAPSPARPPPAPPDESAPRAAQLAAEQAAAERQADEQRRVAEQRAEAEAKATAEATAEAKAAAARAARAAQQEAKAAAAKRAQAQSAAERQQREQELRQQLANEERLDAARTSGEMDRYRALIQRRIISNWHRPVTARAGLSCEVRVTQVPGGTVTAVQIGKCNGDASVRDSIESAVYSSSPLPEPPTPELFERSLLFNFQPDE